MGFTCSRYSTPQVLEFRIFTFVAGRDHLNCIAPRVLTLLFELLLPVADRRIEALIVGTETIDEDLYAGDCLALVRLRCDGDVPAFRRIFGMRSGDRHHQFPSSFV